MATIENISADATIYLDSAAIGGYFSITDSINDTLAPGDSTSFIILFAPDSTGAAAESLFIYHADGVFEEIINATACDSDSVYFEPAVIELEDVYSSKSWTTQLHFDICQACSLFDLIITDATWANGVYFSDDIWITTVMNLDSSAIAVEIDYDPSPGLTGLDDDTLTITFAPDESYRCTKQYYAMLVVDVVAEDFECVPTPECRGIEKVRPCDTVKGSESIYFTGICDGTVSIYDRLGRFIIELSPDVVNTVEWKLVDEDGNPVPSGIYYWESGGEHGNIVVVR